MQVRLRVIKILHVFVLKNQHSILHDWFCVQLFNLSSSISRLVFWSFILCKEKKKKKQNIIINSIKIGLEFFNITFEFIEKNLNTRVLRHRNNNSQEKKKNKTLVDRKQLFLFFILRFLQNIFSLGDKLKQLKMKNKQKKYGKFCMHPFARLFHF